MGKSIDDSFLEYFQWYFPNFLSRADSLYLVCNLQFAFQPFYCLFVLLQKRTSKSLVVKYIHFFCTLEQHTPYNGIEKHVLRITGKKQHTTTFCHAVVIKNPHTVEHLIIVNIRNNMCFSLKLIEIIFVQLLHEIDIGQGYSIKIYAFMKLEHFTYFLNIRQFLAVCPFT